MDIEIRKITKEKISEFEKDLKKLDYKEEATLNDDAFHMDWIYLSKKL